MFQGRWKCINIGGKRVEHRNTAEPAKLSQGSTNKYGPIQIMAIYAKV